MTNPFLGFIRTLNLLLTGRAVFDGAAAGKTISTPDGKRFTVFRRVQIRVKPGTPEPGAVFLVRFRPSGMTVWQNVRFSLLPMLIFMGFTGFRSKYWAVDEASGLCQGLYEWQTLKDAENYAQSVAMRFMARRSDPASVEWRVIDRSNERFDCVVEDSSVNKG